MDTISILNITVATIVLSIFVIVASTVYFMKVDLRSFTKDALRCDSIPHEEKDNLIHHLTNVYKFLNPKTLQSLTTEFFYYAVESNVSIFKRLGIRKEMKLIPNTHNHNKAKGNIYINDGKNNSTYESETGRYIEKYIDNKTEKVLYKKEIKNAILVLEFNKLDSKIEVDTTKCCANCGAPMQLKSDFYNCEYCGAHYTSENFQWTLANYVVSEQKTSNLLALAYITCLASALLLSLLNEYRMIKELYLILLVIDAALIIFAIIVTIFMNVTMGGFKQLQKKDPLIVKRNFENRVAYLLTIFNYAKEFQLSKVAPFVTPKMYTTLTVDTNSDHFYLLDFNVIRTVVKKVYTKDDLDIVSLIVKLKETSMNEKKRLRKKTKKMEVSVCRSSHIDKTKISDNANSIICSSCGASINLTADGKCSFCDTKYDLSKYDWILYKI